MRNKILNTFLINIISALFILLFVYTSINKLLEYTNFQNVLASSPSIGFAAAFLAWFLPAVELLTAALLFAPELRTWGFRASLILMAIFSCYLAYMILFTSDRPCNCGGVLKQLSWSQHFFLNLILTAMALTGLWLHQRNKRFIAINRNSRTPV